MSEVFSLSKTRSSGTRTVDSAISKSLNAKLIAYAQSTQASNLKVGFGVIGWFPFLSTIIGIAVVFITSVVMATQSGLAKDNGQSFFWVTVIGISLTAIGIVLSLINLAEIISFIKFAASEDPMSPFVFRTPIEEAEYQAKVKEAKTQVALQAVPNLTPGFLTTRRNVVPGAPEAVTIAKPGLAKAKTGAAFSSDHSRIGITLGGQRTTLDIPSKLEPCRDADAGNEIFKYLSQVKQRNPDKIEIPGPSTLPAGQKYQDFLSQYQDIDCNGVRDNLQNDAQFVEQVLNFFAKSSNAEVEVVESAFRGGILKLAGGKSRMLY